MNIRFRYDFWFIFALCYIDDLATDRQPISGIPQLGYLLHMNAIDKIKRTCGMRLHSFGFLIRHIVSICYGFNLIQYFYVDAIIIFSSSTK